MEHAHSITAMDARALFRIRPARMHRIALRARTTEAPS